jgi:hypothetical protein
MRGRTLIIVCVAVAMVCGLGYLAVRVVRTELAAAQAQARRSVEAAVREKQAQAEAAAAEAEREAAAQGQTPPEAGVKSQAGSGEQGSYVTSITIEGLDKAGLTVDDIAGLEVELDDRPPALGRPLGRTATLGSLIKPASPLTLYRSEQHRAAAAIVRAINDKGIVGVFVSTDDPEGKTQHPADGSLRWKVFVGTIVEIRVEDQRRPKGPDAELDEIRRDCPVKVGGHIIKPDLDAFSNSLRQRLNCGVDCVLAPGKQAEDVVLTIILRG